jgi:fused signal recognition particle receptor
MFRRKSAATSANEQKTPSFFQRLRQQINRGSILSYDLANLLPNRRIDDALLEEIETRLLLADVGVDATGQLMSDLHKKVARQELGDMDALFGALRAGMLEILAPCAQPLELPGDVRPFMILAVGVNGSGKTTTIGKLARRYRDEGRSVMLAAGDTFRAAAVEQLQVWGERNGVPVIAQASGADPAAVVYDAYAAARARKIDVLIADTAGRLHTQGALMEELKKIKRVVRKLDESAPHETLLVLDGGTGQNAIAQAEQFHAALGLTGLVITKLDGTAKGGFVLAIAKRMRLPIRFIGVGEQAEDLGVFDAGQFLSALLAEPEDSSA